MMKPVAVIFGVNGFLGRYLARHWTRSGFEVVAVGRSQRGWGGDGMFLPWDGKNPGPWELALEGAAVVVNLAGRSVNCRYEEKNRRAILDSRIDSTKAIGAAIRKCRKPPGLWINVGTATYYRHAVDGPQDEWRGEPGDGFSVDVARRWEDVFFGDATPAAVRKIVVRTGMVMANEKDTAFAILKRLAQFGLAGAMGSGDQRVSWIHIRDWLDALDFLLANPLLDGVFNLTAPECPTNRRMLDLLREKVAMPLGLPTAEWMIALGAFLMKTEPELVLKSRWVEPARLIDEGFVFRWPQWSNAVEDLLTREGLAGHFRESSRRSMGLRAWAQA